MVQEETSSLHQRTAALALRTRKGTLSLLTGFLVSLGAILGVFLFLLPEIAKWVCICHYRPTGLYRRGSGKPMEGKEDFRDGYDDHA